ncbi:hypothetical protein P9293_20190 [Bacillus inaquosorum]|uniref:hypothetical protein n=1 Tax=Bacillus inaquosorum TaxID=483913 RepID=UPI002E22177B|nr:hypothetical protein [Bacillus inaquosorum]MED4790599.1 hypothetical protein [Bacillus inaquosorum]
MKLRKSVASLLAVSALSFSIGGIASAQKPVQSNHPLHLNSLSEDAPFKTMARSVTINVGKSYPIDDNASWAVVVKGSQYVEVSGREIIGLKDSGSNKAEVWMYKSNGALLGALYVTVRK